VKVLLSTIGSRGDVQPLVALALHLMAAQHQVRLCVPPDFQDWIERLGIPVTPVGPSVRGTAAPPPAAAPQAPPTAEQLRQVIDGTVAAQFEAVTAAADECDVIVAATALQIAAHSVAERQGIRYVFAAYCPIVFPSPHHAPPPLPPAPGEAALPATAGNAELWAQNAARTNATWRDSLNAYRASLGMPAIDDVRGYMFTDRPWLAADPTLAPWPEAGDGGVVQTGAWLDRDERPLSLEIEAFLDSGDPPVYFGFSSLRAPQDLGQTMADSARAVGRRAIISRGWAGVSPAQSEPDCLVIDEANLQALFRRVAAVVHHGGAGTTTIATLAGTPQVVVPQIYDQHYFAQRIQALGIGTTHPAGAPTPDSLAAALDRALPSEVQTRARALAPAVRWDGVEAAARQLTGAPL
jgi:vancomycin aglycone glucosyltransferase